jgi:hypothetical protein
MIGSTAEPEPDGQREHAEHFRPVRHKAGPPAWQPLRSLIRVHTQEVWSIPVSPGE